MNKRTTLLPVILVAIIATLAVIAIVSGRSNDTGLVADRTYPYQICSFNRYCAGDACTSERQSFIVYLAHADGQPRIELPYVNPSATLELTLNGVKLETKGGQVAGTLEIFNDRGLDWIGTAGAGESLVEHFASGRCERLKQP